MKQYEYLQPMDGFRPNIYFKNEFAWNEFKPLFIASEGNDQDIYLEFVGKKGNAQVTNPELRFSVSEFKKLWHQGGSILKEVNSDLELRICKRNANNEIVPISGSQVGDFKIEIGFELNLN